VCHEEVKGDKVLLLLIYVDNILATVDEQESVDLEEPLIDVFRTVLYQANNESS
jgi:hypothetical protein